MKIYSYCLKKKDFKGEQYIKILKEHLILSKAFVYDIKIGKTFKTLKNIDIWLPTEEDYKMIGFEGHCVSIRGFSDIKNGGAFLLINSWGEEWGENGKIWIRYSDFLHFSLNGEAYFYIYESVFNMLSEETKSHMKKIRKD